MSEDVFIIANLESGPHREETDKMSNFGGKVHLFLSKPCRCRLAYFATSESNILHVLGVQRLLFIDWGLILFDVSVDFLTLM